MRHRHLLIAALVALPAALNAQVGRLPRGGRIPVGEPAPLPPAVPPVARALAIQRSRWSAEGYSLISSLQTPSVAGGFTTSTTFGAGTRADYRFAEHFAATGDITASIAGGPLVVGTAELGTRYTPLARTAELRPFVDLRAAFVHVYDNFGGQGIPAGLGGVDQQYSEAARYSRGFGGIAGTGVEVSLTNSMALTTEILATRNLMTMYRVSGPGSIPTGADCWATSFRYTLGLRYNATRILNLSQNPMK